jgi:ABC-type multidrug transport system ATPase subunit
MFICPKCKHEIELVESQICPHCRLLFFDDTHTTWIGSSLDCDIIFESDQIPAYAGAITLNEETKEFELINLAGQDFPIYRNRKKVFDKETISIDDKVKIDNIIFDCNHPKISKIFLGEFKAQLVINYEAFDLLSVGNHPDADIILEELPPGKILASIIRSKDNFFLYQPEIGEKVPIFIDNYRLESDELSLIDENDNIYIHDVKLPVFKIPDLLDKSSPFYSPRKYPMIIPCGKFIEKPITIGQSNCDIILQSEKISHKHITLHQIDDDNFFVEDNNSFTGAYLSEKKIRDAVIQFNDVITFGNHELKIYKEYENIIIRIDVLKGKFRVDGQNISRVAGSRIKFRNQSNTKIIDNISFSIGAGEFVGIMGPSGCGKTTLLKILAGVDRLDNKNFFGNLYYNFSKIDKENHTFDNEVGYLPQDDILFADLTVYECLYYSAKLRMPNLKKDDINKLIDNVLYNLNLEKDDDSSGKGSIKGLKIGSINKPGAISGGQRKRINLAVELLSNPSVLFLDEPTSGLSSIDSEKLMDLLAHINNMGTTIVTTIHQPSKQVFEKFDKIMILTTYGTLAYFGSVSKSLEYFESHSKLKFEKNKNPASFVLEALETKSPEEWKLIYENSEDYIYYIKRHLVTETGKARQTDEIVHTSNLKRARFEQFKTLFMRNLKLKTNNMGTLLLLLLQAPLIATLIGFLFSGPLFDGPLLETRDEPIEDYKRIHYYTQLSNYKKKFDFLPPYKTFFISFYNQLGDSVYLYSQIIDSSRIGGGWTFLRDGPHKFSRAAIKNNNKIGEEFPYEKGNFKFVISHDSMIPPNQLVKLLKLDKEKNYFLFNDTTAIINWYDLSAENKKIVWKNKILAERQKYLKNEEFDNFKVIDSSSILSFINPIFDGTGIFNSMKKYLYATELGRYGWYDINADKEYFYTSKREYKEKATTYLYLFFVVIIAFIWIGMTNSVKDIVLERPVFLRERLRNLNLLSYVGSKYLVLFIISIVQVAAFLFILFLFIGSAPINYFDMIAIMMLTITVSLGLGLVISSLANQIEFAISLLPLTLIPQLLLAGVFKHIGTMGVYLRGLADLMISRWSLEAIVNAISDKVDYESPYINTILPFKNIIYPCYTPSKLEDGSTLPGYFPYPIEINYFTLLLFCLVLLIGAILILKLKRR